MESRTAFFACRSPQHSPRLLMNGSAPPQLWRTVSIYQMTEQTFIQTEALLKLTSQTLPAAEEETVRDKETEDQEKRPTFSRRSSTPCPICRLLSHQEFHWEKNCTRVRLTDDRTDATTTNTANAPPQNDGTGANVMQTRLEPNHVKIFINGQLIIGLIDTCVSFTCVSKRAA